MRTYFQVVFCQVIVKIVHTQPSARRIALPSQLNFLQPVKRRRIYRSGSGVYLSTLRLLFERRDGCWALVYEQVIREDAHEVHIL